LVDMPVMKKPNLTSVKSLMKHVSEAENNIKVDVAMLAYISDANLHKIEKFINNGIVFGFNSFLSAPLNRKLDEITEEGLIKALETLCEQPE